MQVVEGHRDGARLGHPDYDVDLVRLEGVDTLLPLVVLLPAVDAGEGDLMPAELFLNAGPRLGEVEHDEHARPLRLETLGHLGYCPGLAELGALPLPQDADLVLLCYGLVGVRHRLVGGDDLVVVALVEVDVADLADLVREPGDVLWAHRDEPLAHLLAEIAHDCLRPRLVLGELEEELLPRPPSELPPRAPVVSAPRRVPCLRPGVEPEPVADGVELPHRVGEGRRHRDEAYARIGVEEDERLRRDGRVLLADRISAGAPVPLVHDDDGVLREPPSALPRVEDAASRSAYLLRVDDIDYLFLDAHRLCYVPPLRDAYLRAYDKGFLTETANRLCGHVGLSASGRRRYDKHTPVRKRGHGLFDHRFLKLKQLCHVSSLT